MPKYLSFLEAGSSASGKTKVLIIMNTDQTYTLGHIKWFGPWRKYVACFAVTPPPIYDAGCLRELAEKLDELNVEHRANRKEVAST